MIVELSCCHHNTKRGGKTGMLMSTLFAGCLGEGGWMDGPEQVEDSSLACRNVGMGGGFSTLVTSSSFSITNE